MIKKLLIFIFVTLFSCSNLFAAEWPADVSANALEKNGIFEKRKNPPEKVVQELIEDAPKILDIQRDVMFKMKGFDESKWHTDSLSEIKKGNKFILIFDNKKRAVLYDGEKYFHIDKGNIFPIGGFQKPVHMEVEDHLNQVLSLTPDNLDDESTTENESVISAEYSPKNLKEKIRLKLVTKNKKEVRDKFVVKVLDQENKEKTVYSRELFTKKGFQIPGKEKIHHDFYDFHFKRKIQKDIEIEHQNIKINEGLSDNLFKPEYVQREFLK